MFIKNKSGFTLVEVVLAMAIFSLVLVVIISSITGLYRIYRGGVGIRDTQQQARIISEDITRATRDAAHIVTGTNAVCLYYPVAQSGGNLITDSQIFAALDAGTQNSSIVHRRVSFTNLSPSTACNISSYPSGGERVLTSNEVSVMLFHPVASSIISATPPRNTLLTFDVRLASRRAFLSEIDFSVPYNPATPYTTGPTCFDGASYCSMTSLSSTAQARSQLAGGAD